MNAFDSRPYRASRLWGQYQSLLRAESRDDLGRHRIQSLGSLSVSSGQIALSDPFNLDTALTLSQPVSPGDYKFDLWISRRVDTSDAEVVVASVIRLGESAPIDWLLASEDYYSPQTNTESRYSILSVDSGNCSLMDALALEFLQEQSAQSSEMLSAIHDELERNYQTGYMWANLKLRTPETLNIVAFTAGLGDGGYQSCWGIDANDAVVCLLTDFDINVNND